MTAKLELPADALVLVVDDEELVREVASMMVEDAGAKTLNGV